MSLEKIGSWIKILLRESKKSFKLWPTMKEPKRAVEWVDIQDSLFKSNDKKEMVFNICR